jgi:BA14K-like protein
MFRKRVQLVLSAVLITSALVAEIGVANALPTISRNKPVDMQVNEVLPVQYMQHRRSGVTMSWQFQRDGNRCRNRYGRCRHYYQGYYYETPWWILPLFLGDQMTDHNYGNSHVRWCLSRYRSYNPRTDLWLGSSGRRYRCNSPY